MNLNNTIDRIKEMLDDKNNEALKGLLGKYHSADLAEILPQLKEDERIKCFLLIDKQKEAEILEYLSPQYQVEILSGIDEQLASDANAT